MRRLLLLLLSLCLPGLAQADGGMGPGPGLSVTAYKIPAFVQGAFQISFNTCAYSAAQSAGNLNLLAIGWDQAGFSVNTVTDTLGNTYAAVAAATSTGNASQQLYYSAGILGGSNTITVTWTGGTMPTGLDLRCGEWSGVATSSPLDQKASSASASGTAINSGTSATTTQSAELLIGAGYVFDAISGVGSGYTQRVFSAGNNNIQDEGVTSIGAYSATATQNTSGFWIEQLATFKAATGGSTPVVSTPLLTYLNSLRLSGQLLSGQTADLFASPTGGSYGNQLDQFTGTTPASMTISDHATGNTGKTPAILAVNMPVPGWTCGIGPTPTQAVNLIEDSITAGNIVLVTVVPARPTDATQCQIASTGTEFPNVLKVGGVCTHAECNNYFYGYGANSASPTGGVWAEANQFNAIAAHNPNTNILYRPLHENNLSNIFWWGAGGSGPSAAQEVQLYQQTVDQLRAQGVNNVIYGESENWFSGNYAAVDPGASYRSFIGVDTYCCNPTDSAAAVQSAISGSLPNGGGGWAYANSLNIPVIAMEVGNNNANNGSTSQFTYDVSHWDNAMQAYANGSNLVGTVLFTQNWCLQCQLNAAGYLSGSITRSQLPPLTATAFYVSPSGNDSNAGTLAAPFLTLGKAQTSMRASAIKTTYLRSGTYSSTALALSSSDNGETWSYYAPDGFNTAIVDGGSSSQTSGGNPVLIDGGSNITINGLKVQNCKNYCIGVHGGEPDGTAGFPSNVATTDGNTITNSVIDTVYNTANNGWAGGGFWISGKNTNLSITENVIQNTYGSAIRIVKTASSQDSTNLTYTFTGLKISGNAILNTDIFTSDNGAIYLEDFNNLSTNISIANNFIRDYQQNPATTKSTGTLYRNVPVYLDSGTSNVTISGNVIGSTANAGAALLVTNGSANSFYNAGGQNNRWSGNIIDLGATAAVVLLAYDDQLNTATGNSFTGNIVIGKWAGSQAGTFFGKGPAGYYYADSVTAHYPTVTHNLYFNFGGGTIRSDSTNAGGSDASPVTATDPLFVSGGQCIYTLNGGSSVFGSPLNFPPIVGGWGPPGYTIPCTGTSPSF